MINSIVFYGMPGFLDKRRALDTIILIFRMLVVTLSHSIPVSRYKYCLDVQTTS